MSEAIFFLAIGLAFLTLLLLWIGRSAGANKDDISKVQGLLAIVDVELPPRALGERIFAPQDWDFVSKRTAPAIQRMFLQERKALAYSWLRQTREKVGLLMEFHRKAARSNIHLSPTLEFRLAFDYILFLMTYEILRGLIWWRGPFYARRIVVHVTGMADQLSYLSGHVLVGMDSGRLSEIKNNWSGRAAAG